MLCIIIVTNWGLREKEHMSKTFVTINGTVYDKVTGLPIRSAADDTAGHTPRHGHAKDVHSRLQRSKTLNRRYVERAPIIPVPHKIEIEAAVEQTAPVVAVAESPVQERAERVEILEQAEPVKVALPVITKYAPHPAPKPTKVISEITPATPHPIAVKAASSQARLNRQPRAAVVTDIVSKPTPAKSQARRHKPSDIIKAEATAKALAEAPSHNRAPHRDKHATRNKKQRFNRMVSFATSGAALLLIAGYFTYVNMPNLSVRVAAVQAGVDAGYPSYRPSGYSLAGPVAYEDGQVRMAFSANGTKQNFTLSQTRTNWDSSAVVENYVEPKAGTSYLTTTENGITVYSWSGNAAWVSNGILHTIDGDASLSPDQIHRMASSL